MKLKRVLFFIITICCLAHSVKAQDTFYGEIGVTGGCGFMLGDANKTLFRFVKPVGGGYLKYKFNGHYELRLQVDGGEIGYAKNESTQYIGAQVLGEFNFFNFGVKKWMPYRTWVTPTILAGLGIINFGFEGKTRVAATVPLGIGVKFKLSNRVNLGAYWTVAKVFSDHLDKMPNPNGEYGKFWVNQDWYSTAQIYLSINFARICAPCRSGVHF